tara:strand:- start:59 stop:661 length:603 start_codon:yes stop_codon:yes gene_type:complete
MRRNTLFFIFLFLVKINLAQLELHRWSDDSYGKYNSDSFQKLEIVNQKIDVVNIDYPLLNAAIFYSTNLQREKYRKIPFIFSKYLTKAAQEHSEDMVEFKFYSHTSKVRGKKTMSERLKLVGISNAFTAENIFDFFLKSPTYWSLAQGLVNGWMESKGHRANILNKNYEYLGCGSKYYFNKDWIDHFYVKSTQNFSSISP